MKINAIIMAAGKSERMGQNKLLLKYKDLTFIEILLSKILKINFQNILIIYSDEDVKKNCLKYMHLNNIKSKKNKKIIIIKNKNYKKGQSESIKLGIQTLKKMGELGDGSMFFSGDQPFLTEETIKKILYNFEKNKILIPLYGDKRGLPTIFSTKFSEELLELKGDIGGKPVIENNKKSLKIIKIENEIEGLDVDTKEEYEKILNIEKG